MKAPLLAGVLVAILLAVELSAASTVRGKLYRLANGRPYPASGVGVHLLDSQGSPRTARSTSDGFFYFYNVPAGSYTLEVRGGRDAQRFVIEVNERGYTDIAPIEVP